MIKRLGWDSNFFDFNVGKAVIEDFIQIGLEKTKRLATEKGYQLIYLMHELNLRNNLAVPNNISDFATGLNAKLVDTKVYFRQNISASKGAIHLEGAAIWEKGDPVDLFYGLAFQSGIFSRFKNDPEFPEGSFERLYQLWIDNSLNGVMADFLVYMKEEGQLTGFVTLKLNEAFGNVGLLAVDENFRGKQIARKLMETAKQITLKQGLKEIRVATQLQNEPACRFYESNGYQLFQATAIWHWWI